jgi:hypothetical protein
MTDIMVRIMRNDALTLRESHIYNTVRDICRDAEYLDGLYILFIAINDVAVLRGLRLQIDLRRLRMPKRARQHIREFKESLKGLGPNQDRRAEAEEDEREMGPLERELRAADSDNQGHLDLGRDAFRVYRGARVSLRLQCITDPDEIDIMSEAIEAAEALGL